MGRFRHVNPVRDHTDRIPQAKGSNISGLLYRQGPKARGVVQMRLFKKVKRQPLFPDRVLESPRVHHPMGRDHVGDACLPVQGQGGHRGVHPEAMRVDDVKPLGQGRAQELRSVPERCGTECREGVHAQRRPSGNISLGVLVTQPEHSQLAYCQLGNRLVQPPHAVEHAPGASGHRTCYTAYLHEPVNEQYSRATRGSHPLSSPNMNVCMTRGNRVPAR